MVSVICFYMVLISYHMQFIVNLAWPYYQSGLRIHPKCRVVLIHSSGKCLSMRGLFTVRCLISALSQKVHSFLEYQTGHLVWTALCQASFKAWPRCPMGNFPPDKQLSPLPATGVLTQYSGHRQHTDKETTNSQLINFEKQHCERGRS